VVESRAGGSGIIAHETVAKSAPDGHTSLLVVPAGAHTINPGLFNKAALRHRTRFHPDQHHRPRSLVLVAQIRRSTSTR
jgi:tripartite-type tricarboxylate transporter receptor subunit TctC